jgi:hypothetical protein
MVDVNIRTPLIITLVIVVLLLITLWAASRQ